MKKTVLKMFYLALTLWPVIFLVAFYTLVLRIYLVLGIWPTVFGLEVPPVLDSYMSKVVGLVIWHIFIVPFVWIPLTLVCWYKNIFSRTFLKTTLGVYAGGWILFIALHFINSRVWMWWWD